MKGDYAPNRGDYVWMDFHPQAGHEQAGRRPALVLSPKEYNVRAGLALVCPITSKEKGYSFEVKLPEGDAVAGVVLADQLRSLDWKIRRAEFVGTADSETVEETLMKLQTLLQIDQ